MLNSKLNKTLKRWNVCEISPRSPLNSMLGTCEELFTTKILNYNEDIRKLTFAECRCQHQLWKTIFFYLLRHLMEQQTFHIERFDLLSKLNMTFQKLHFFIRPHLSIVRPYWDGQEQGRWFWLLWIVILYTKISNFCFLSKNLNNAAIHNTIVRVDN